MRGIKRIRDTVPSFFDVENIEIIESAYDMGIYSDQVVFYKKYDEAIFTKLGEYCSQMKQEVSFEICPYIDVDGVLLLRITITPEIL